MQAAHGIQHRDQKIIGTDPAQRTLAAPCLPVLTTEIPAASWRIEQRGDRVPAVFPLGAVRGMISRNSDNQILDGDCGQGRIKPLKKFHLPRGVEIMGADIRPFQMNKNDLMFV